jgi:hypothetical protein
MDLFRGRICPCDDIVDFVFGWRLKTICNGQKSRRVNAAKVVAGWNVVLLGSGGT